MGGEGQGRVAKGEGYKQGGRDGRGCGSRGVEVEQGRHKILGRKAGTTERAGSRGVGMDEANNREWWV